MVNVNSWLKRRFRFWLLGIEMIPEMAYVIVEKGEPVCVALTQTAAAQEIARHDQRRTKVFTAPILREITLQDVVSGGV